MEKISDLKAHISKESQISKLRFQKNSGKTGGSGFFVVLGKLFVEFLQELLLVFLDLEVFAFFVIQAALALDFGILEGLHPAPELPGDVFGFGYEILKFEL